MKKNYSSDIQNLSLIEEDIDIFCEKNNIGNLCFAINLSVEEVFVNIIYHAYKKALDKFVEIELNLLENGVEIYLRDNAGEFNILECENSPDIQASIEDRKIGGLGILFVKKHMDKISYTRKDGINELKMFKKFI